MTENRENPWQRDTVTMISHRSLVLALWVGVVMPTAVVAADSTPQGILLDPAASRTHIAFVAARTLYVVDRSGGVARPLMRDPIAHTPRFSPDGRSIAYGGLVDGHTDLFVIPVTGGKPHRVTHTPLGKAIFEWTPDGRLLFNTNTFSFYRVAMQLYTVPARGGLPTKLPVAFGADATLSPDGRWLAYTPTWQPIRSWKRYAGGMAQHIRLLDLKTGAARRLTAWHGTDARPMWRGDRLYYLSDKGWERRLNLWLYDIKTRKHRQLTHFQEFDVQSPSIGPGPEGKGEIVFQYAGGIRALDLAPGRTSTTPVERLQPSPSTSFCRRRIERSAFARPTWGEIYRMPIPRPTAARWPSKRAATSGSRPLERARRRI
jgi:tricorn protease